MFKKVEPFTMGKGKRCIVKHEKRIIERIDTLRDFLGNPTRQDLIAQAVAWYFTNGPGGSLYDGLVVDFTMSEHEARRSEFILINGGAE
jgi:hypothetical protein